MPNMEHRSERRAMSFGVRPSVFDVRCSLAEQSLLRRHARFKKKSGGRGPPIQGRCAEDLLRQHENELASAILRPGGLVVSVFGRLILAEAHRMNAVGRN